VSEVIQRDINLKIDRKQQRSREDAKGQKKGERSECFIAVPAEKVDGNSSRSRTIHRIVRSAFKIRGMKAILLGQ
jgi:hypothetical protein